MDNKRRICQYDYNIKNNSWAHCHKHSNIRWNENCRNCRSNNCYRSINNGSNNNNDYNPPNATQNKLFNLLFRKSKAYYCCTVDNYNNHSDRKHIFKDPYDLFKKEEKEKVKKIIELIQKFDPIGICVPNIIESLILQAKHHKLEANIIKILEKAELLEKTQEKLKEELKIRSKEFNKALEIIRQKLNPNPTLEFKDPEDTNFYIDPDILIINHNNKFEIKIKEVNIFKKELKKTTINPQKQKKAKWLIESLRYRDEILAKIGIAIYTLQKEFLRRGFKSLRPMNLSILSEKISVSKSTISRAIKNKYLKCEWGTILIKELFSSVGGAKTNEFSKLSIKITVKKLLEVNKKMSDKAISAILKSKGISISRRTVNKYRNELKSEKGKIYYGT